MNLDTVYHTGLSRGGGGAALSQIIPLIFNAYVRSTLLQACDQFSIAYKKCSNIGSEIMSLLV